MESSGGANSKIQTYRLILPEIWDDINRHLKNMTPGTMEHIFSMEKELEKILFDPKISADMKRLLYSNALHQLQNFRAIHQQQQQNQAQQVQHQAVTCQTAAFARGIPGTQDVGITPILWRSTPQQQAQPRHTPKSTPLQQQHHVSWADLPQADGMAEMEAGDDDIFHNPDEETGAAMQDLVMPSAAPLQPQVVSSSSAPIQPSSSKQSFFASPSPLVTQVEKEPIETVRKRLKAPASSKEVAHLPFDNLVVWKDIEALEGNKTRTGKKFKK